MTARMPRVDLVEIVDGSGLDRMSAVIVGDPDGMAEFGGFYGSARERLGPLLGADRRAWLIVVDGRDAGFLDADRSGEEVGLGWFVRMHRRRQGVARSALERLLRLRPWADAEAYVAAIDVGNIASGALARAAGFGTSERNDDGEEVWRRPLVPRAPAPRGSRGRGHLDELGELGHPPVAR